MLLSSSEIASALAGGDVHLGVTGEDLIREAAPELEGRVALLKPLGFGFADVVVAVPRSLDRRLHHGRSRRCLRRLRPAPSPPPAHRHEIRPADARLLRPCRHFRLPHRRQRRRHRRRADRGHRRSHRRHHHHGRDAQGQRAENPRRRRDPEKPGATRHEPRRRLDRRNARAPPERLLAAAGAAKLGPNSYLRRDRPGP